VEDSDLTIFREMAASVTSWEGEQLI
jgi:hypothetical protein